MVRRELWCSGLLQWSHDLHRDVVLEKAKKNNPIISTSLHHLPPLTVNKYFKPLQTLLQLLRYTAVPEVGVPLLPAASTAGWRGRARLWWGGWGRWRGTWIFSTQWTSWSYTGWWTKRRTCPGVWGRWTVDGVILTGGWESIQAAGYWMRFVSSELGSYFGGSSFGFMLGSSRPFPAGFSSASSSPIISSVISTFPCEQKYGAAT